MMDFMRSLRGLKDETATRQVVGGAPVGFGLQEVEFIKSSNLRLSLLQDLANRYGATPHATKLKQAYQKTKSIHSFLVTKKKVHVLEMFHLQHTDHFIATFTIILETYLDHNPVPRQTSASSAGQASSPTPRRVAKAQDLPEMIKPLKTHGQFFHGTESRAPVPRLYAPDISINTFENITFLHENAEGQLVAHHVGATSSPEEKDVFLQHVSSRLGLAQLTYVGNAHLTIPNSSGITPTGMVPIIYWEGFRYAVNLNDYRLFPVGVFRK